VNSEAQVLTVAMGLGADDPLRAIVQAAVASEPARHHATAHGFREQLAQWSTPSAGAAALRPAASAPAEEDVMGRLLCRMQENEDFPAMTHAVSRIQAMVTSDTESVGAVTDETLKDVALSNKLLRIVNSAYCARGGGISSISRAVTLIGFNRVRNMAMGLALLEGMRDKVHAQALTQGFLRALMAASIAREIGSDSRDGEETFIGAMFQNLGRLLAMFYFSLDATKVQQLVHAGAGKLTEDSASTRVLGLSYQALGLGVAKIWDLPPDIRRYMHKPVGDPPPGAAADVQERLRWTMLAANQLADTLLQSEPAEQGARVDLVLKMFARAMDKTPDEIRQAMERARGEADRTGRADEVANLALQCSGVHVAAGADRKRDASKRACRGCVRHPHCSCDRRSCHAGARCRHGRRPVARGKAGRRDR
jgi:HD-like signal output (HDOD) protein